MKIQVGKYYEYDPPYGVDSHFEKKRHKYCVVLFDHAIEDGYAFCDVQFVGDDKTSIVGKTSLKAIRPNIKLIESIKRIKYI